MKTKRFLSLVVALCMVLAFVPAMASAAEEQVLFDMADIAEAIAGQEVDLNGEAHGLVGTGYVKLNGRAWTDGAWVGSNGTSSVLSFFKNTGKGGNDVTEAATFANSALTVGAEKITVDFKLALTNAETDNYGTWYIRDVDGKRFARFFWDVGTAKDADPVENAEAKYGVNTDTSFVARAEGSREQVLALRNVPFRVEAVKAAEGYTVTYSKDDDKDGTYDVFGTETIDSINGIGSIEVIIGAWSVQWSCTGMQDLKVTYVVPETMKNVTATYTVNGEVVDTVKGTYDTASEAGAAFAEKSYSLDGSGVLYHADAAVLAEDTTIEMAPVVNAGPYAVGDTVTSEGKLYKVKGENLIPNGDFAYGLTGWFNGQDAASTAAVNGDGTVTIQNGGTNSPQALYRSWPIEAGKTYVFTYTNGTSNEYHVLALTNTLGAHSDNEMVKLVGKGGTVAATDAVGTNNFVFTNDAGYAYARIQYRWASGNVVGNFGLYEVEEDAEAKDATVVYKTADGTVIKTVSEQTKTSITVPGKEIFVTDGGYYTLPEATAAAGETVEVTVENTPNKYGVIEDALVSDNEVWGIKKDNENSIFVAAGADANRAPLADANGTPLAGREEGSDPSTLGKSRVGLVEFPVVDLADGQKAVAHFYVRTWHHNGFSNGNKTLRIAATVVNDSSWTALSDGGKYDSVNTPKLETYPNAIFSNVCTEDMTDLTIDVTEAMKAAKAAGLTALDLRLNSAWGSAYIAEREAAVEGGKYEGKAAYIEVVDAGAVNVTTTSVDMIKNGSLVGKSATVTADDDVRFNSDAAVVLAGDKLYIPKETKVAAEAADLETTELTFGIEMKGGQVRVGTGVTAENKVGENSGIRFVAVVDRENTIANEADEIGVTLTAAGSDKSVDVPTVKFQDETDTVFTVAVTNLAESNYNRNYTAVPYAKVTLADGTEKTFTGNSATRSAYAVSAGLLKNGAVDLVEGDTYVVDEAVASVLNAYVNQTGVRIVIENGAAAVASTYTGDVFFDVTSVKNGDSYEITITPDASFVTPVTISDWWKDYVRVNNNNSTAKGFISNEKIENGVLTFTFTPVA